MTSAGDQPRTTFRPLSDNEAELWTAVTRRIKPLKPRRIAELPRAAPRIEPPRPAASKPRSQAPAQPAAPRPVPRPLAGFDRRLKRRIARGQAEIDARIDLHGLTEQDAHAELIRFLRRCLAADARLVLVITGKGTARGRTAGQHGVLRRQVPHWLASQPLRSHVLSFEPAHASHGGEGALYVRLHPTGRARR